MKKIGKSVCKETIIYGLATVVLFGMFLVFTFFPGYRQPEKEPLSYLILGDSIMGQYRDETSVAARIAEKLQVSVLNGAMGGTTLSLTEESVAMANLESCLSMYALSKAIIADDFGAQQTVRSRWNGAEYFVDTIDKLERVDFEKLDVLFVQHGSNDYHSGVPVRNEEDAYDPFTYAGALRNVVEGLKGQYPDLRIILVTPTYSWYPYHEIQETCEEYDSGYGVLEDYVNIQLQVAEESNVEVIDLYHDFYPHNEWEDWMLYTTDGVHPNEAGRALIADKICTYMETR